jgi:hypothetical protein
MKEVHITSYDDLFGTLIGLKYQGSIYTDYYNGDVYSYSLKNLIKRIQKKVPEFNLSDAKEQDGKSHIPGQHPLYVWNKKNVA